MAIAITDDHRALAAIARAVATEMKMRETTREIADAAAVDGQPPLWQKIVDLGWTGLHLPDSVGGQGGGLPELAVVIEELGAAVSPGPFLPAVIGSAIVAEARSADLNPLLADAASGTVIAAYARDCGLRRDGSTLDGEAIVVGGVWATHLLLPVGVDLAVVPAGQAGVSMEAATAADPSLGLARVRLSAASATVLPDHAGPALSIARTVAAAEAAGGARATLTMALDYAKVREQFGRTIGSFQAVKHHLANMLIDAERATAAAWDAARAAGRTDGQSELTAAVAATVALAAYQRNAQMNIQIHGGIGFTWEHDAHLYLRRAITLAASYGSPDEAALDTAALSRSGVRRHYHLDLPPEAEVYRADARKFREKFAATPPRERRSLLVDSGYLVPHWPPPYGRAAGSVEQLVLEEEFQDLAIPYLGIGGWVLLTLLQHSSLEQISRWIRPGLEGEQVWCQLFSEPNAGSDAAAIQTRAVRDDIAGGWRITGQKVWTSGAHLCQRGLATVRTDPNAPKHRGITAVVVDLQAPGVEIRPLREISGDALFNEVFFDDVFIPDDDVVGEVNNGWEVARAALGNERVSIGGGQHLRARAADLLDLLEDTGEAAAGFRSEVGRLIAAEQAMLLINLRSVARSVVGSEAGAAGSVTKLLTAEHLQHVTELGLRITGVGAVAGDHPALLREYLLDRSMTIAGGTSEISRNIIAERLLGLPRGRNPR